MFLYYIINYSVISQRNIQKILIECKNPLCTINIYWVTKRLSEYSWLNHKKNVVTYFCMVFMLASFVLLWQNTWATQLLREERFIWAYGFSPSGIEECHGPSHILAAKKQKQWMSLLVNSGPVMLSVYSTNLTYAPSPFVFEIQTCLFVLVASGIAGIIGVYHHAKHFFFFLWQGLTV
jgi:hypothetical protein